MDSVAALVPKAELDGEMGDSSIGLQARLMSKALRKLTGHISKSNCLVIFINQIRMKVGILFGSPETTSGGNALKFYSSVRLDIRKVGQIKAGEEIIGNQVRVKVVKNKVSPPYRQAEFDLIFKKGISKVGEILDFGVQAKLINKSGSWYTVPKSVLGTQFKSEDPAEEQEPDAPLKLGQGREKAKSYLEERPDLADFLEAEIKKVFVQEAEYTEPETDAVVEAVDED